MVGRGRVVAKLAAVREEWAEWRQRYKRVQKLREKLSSVNRGVVDRSYTNTGADC